MSCMMCSWEYCRENLSCRPHGRLQWQMVTGLTSFCFQLSFLHLSFFYSIHLFICAPFSSDMFYWLDRYQCIATKTNKCIICCSCVYWGLFWRRFAVRFITRSTIILLNLLSSSVCILHEIFYDLIVFFHFLLLSMSALACAIESFKDQGISSPSFVRQESTVRFNKCIRCGKKCALSGVWGPSWGGESSDYDLLPSLFKSNKARWAIISF